MTQILNVPMPADEAIKIIRSMFESNRMIEIHVQDSWAYKNGLTIDSLDMLLMVDWTVEDEDDDTCSLSGTVIINSITPITPTYSVWDQVMILSTGEIKTVCDYFILEIWEVWTVEWPMKRKYHRSEICKIA